MDFNHISRLIFCDTQHANTQRENNISFTEANLIYDFNEVIHNNRNFQITEEKQNEQQSSQNPIYSLPPNLL